MTYKQILRYVECDCDSTLYGNCNCHNLTQTEFHLAIYAKKMKAIVSTGIAMRAAQEEYFRLRYDKAKTLRKAIALESKYDKLTTDLLEWQKNVEKIYSSEIMELSDTQKA